MDHEVEIAHRVTHYITKCYEIQIDIRLKLVNMLLMSVVVYRCNYGACRNIFIAQFKNNVSKL